MSPDTMTERTTKYATAVLTVTFHGDYVDVDNIPEHLKDWVDETLHGREDLKGWNLEITSVREVPGDPNGYDR